MGGSALNAIGFRCSAREYSGIGYLPDDVPGRGENTYSDRSACTLRESAKQVPGQVYARVGLAAFGWQNQ
jgi:hypothetical protein